MASSYKTKKDSFSRMVKELKAVDGLTVEVGALTGENAWLAAIHEFGCNITVTPKMRAYLHSRGLHLKDSTTVIRIPERSFLRTGYDTNRDAVLEYAKMLVAEVSEGRLTKDELAEAVGLHLASAIKDYAVDLKKPANHPFTIEQKGSSNPLVGSSGDMIESITWRIAK